MNDNAAAPTLFLDNATSGRAGCSQCHEGAGTTGSGNAHDYPRSLAFGAQTVTGPKIKAGCDMCHGGTGLYWPQAGGSAYPKRPGEHQIHISRLEARFGYAASTTAD